MPTTSNRPAKSQNQRGGWATSWVVLGCLLLVVVVAFELRDDRDPATAVPQTPAAMAIVPAVAEPGQLIEITLPTGEVRSGYFTLRRSGQVLYYLAAGGPGAEPWWFQALDAERHDLAQPKLTGIGPHRLVIPPIAAAGTYLLCTANAVGEACALLTVAR